MIFVLYSKVTLSNMQNQMILVSEMVEFRESDWIIATIEPQIALFWFILSNFAAKWLKNPTLRYDI